ncbi:MAG: hypothetical protein OXF56_06460, partial [Rhodobacteraceae bacterium]|nr:hypothetical protein [Paracoccaceae bacterium]
HFMEIVTGRVAGPGVFHPVEDWCEVLHCPASSLPQVFVFQRGIMQSLRSQDEIFSNAIALPNPWRRLDFVVAGVYFHLRGAVLE